MLRAMTRRIVATALWAYFGWFLAATLASAGLLPAAAAPIGGIVVAAIALYDWRHLRAAPPKNAADSLGASS